MRGNGAVGPDRAPRSGFGALVLAAGLLCALVAMHPASAQTVPDDQLPARATCGPDDVQEDPAIQGRVPQSAYVDQAEHLFNCNLKLVGRHGNSGGYKVQRYVDVQGHECAFYDTTLVIGVDVVDTDGNTPGTFVLDVTDPAAPIHTATIATPAFSSPHESVLLNQKRGLIAAVLANPEFFPGQVDIWDVSHDCRHPVFQSSLPVGTLGHESGFSPDGNTFWTASLHTPHVTAIDVSNPKLPVPLWVGTAKVHGITLSPDGNHAYLAWFGDDAHPKEKGLVILDVSEIQSRKPNPQVHRVSYTTWSNVGTPQIALPVTFKGVPHLIEMDEFGGPNNIGAARIINIADPTKPFVVSTMRLMANQPSTQATLAGDQGMGGTGLQGYRGHYCGVPTTVDPKIVGCTFIVSGLRIFDIADITQPHEAAYFNIVTAKSAHPAVSRQAPYAMSSVTFDPVDGHVWYSDGTAGLFILDLNDDIYAPGQPEGVATPNYTVRPLASSEVAPIGPLPSRTGSLANSGWSVPWMILSLLLLVGSAAGLLMRWSSKAPT